MVERVFGNYYIGHMAKTKGEGGSKGGRWVLTGCGGRGGGKIQKSVIEQ